jgi:hypothetical protein
MPPAATARAQSAHVFAEDALSLTDYVARVFAL